MLARIATALVTSSMLISGCGDGDQVRASSSSNMATARLSVDDLASCLRSGGASVTTSKGEQDSTPWREEGEVETNLGAIDTVMRVMADERGARHQLSVLVAMVGGGTTVDGDRIEDHLGRVHNVSVLFSDVPDVATKRAVESCLGGPMKFDPAGR